MTTPNPLPTTPSELEQLAERLQSDGESIASYCRRHAIKPWKLYQAKQRLTRRKLMAVRDSRPRLAAVRVVEEVSADPLELVLAGGHRLLLRADFDETALRRLLGVLSSC